jgi:hypothetical protein
MFWLADALGGNCTWPAAILPCSVFAVATPILPATGKNPRLPQIKVRAVLSFSLRWPQISKGNNRLAPTWRSLGAEPISAGSRSLQNSTPANNLLPSPQIPCFLHFEAINQPHTLAIPARFPPLQEQFQDSMALKPLLHRTKQAPLTPASR